MEPEILAAIRGHSPETNKCIQEQECMTAKSPPSPTLIILAYMGYERMQNMLRGTGADSLLSFDTRKPYIWV